MRSSALLIVALFAAVALASDPATFEAFKARFNKVYATPELEAEAKKNFENSLALVARSRAANPLATFAITERSDRSPEKPLRRAARSGPTQFRRAASGDAAAAPLPASFDWRTKGFTLPVVSQGQCGSSAVYGDLANIEGVNFATNGKLAALSADYIAACDADSCDGGEFDSPYVFILKHSRGAIPATWSSNATCGGTIVDPAAVLLSYSAIAQNTTALATALVTSGPIAVGLDASSLQTYTGGVITNCISQTVNAVFAIVGYDDTANPPYWIVRTSWGASFGEEGYARIEKKATGAGECLINTAATTCTVKKF